MSLPGAISQEASSSAAASGTRVSNAGADATMTRAGLPPEDPEERRGMASEWSARARAEATFRCGWNPR